MCINTNNNNNDLRQSDLRQSRYTKLNCLSVSGVLILKIHSRIFLLFSTSS